MTESPRTDAVERWLRNNPGQHRARDVARALGLNNNQAAVTLYHLESDGRAARERRTPKGELPYSLWSHPGH